MDHSVYMTLLMKSPSHWVALLLLLLSSLPGSAADQLPEPGQPMIVLLSPSISAQDRKDIWNSFRDLCMKRLGPEERLIVYDGSNMKVVADFTMPPQAKNDKLKIKACTPLLVQLQKFLKPADDGQPVKVPQFLNNLMQRFPDASPRILIVGSPTFADNNKKYDMSKGWLSDGFFNASPAESLFSVAGKKSYLNGAKVYYCFLSDEYFDATTDREVHREKIQTFWAKYVSGLGGKLVAFMPDLRGVIERWQKNDDEQLKHDPIDATDKDMKIMLPTLVQVKVEQPEINPKDVPTQTTELASDFLFASGSAELRPEADAALEQLASGMQAVPSVSYRIEGFTDSHGGEAPNQRLSLKRAEAVRNWLVAKGRVQPKRLQTVGLGETQLKVAPGSSDAEAPNRRVAVIPIQ